MTSPELYGTLTFPDVSKPDVLESSADGRRRMVRVRYEFTGSLDRMARRLIGQRRLVWIQEVVVEPVTNTGEFSFHAAADPRRLYGSGQFELQGDNVRCIRRLSGELVVAAPLIGSRAERKLVPGVLRRLNIEAEAINNALNTRRR